MKHPINYLPVLNILYTNCCNNIIVILMTFCSSLVYMTNLSVIVRHYGVEFWIVWVTTKHGIDTTY